MDYFLPIIRMFLEILTTVIAIISSVMLWGSTAKADDDVPKISSLAPGLVDEVFEPFLESEAFPLKQLIALYPGHPLLTYRGRCTVLSLFGRDLLAQCEKRQGLTLTAGHAAIHWFTTGTGALGLESTEPSPPKNGVLIYTIKSILQIKDGKRVSEDATGSCRVDAFSVDCHTIGKSGRVDVAFATLGGPATHQYPIEDAVFRIPKAEVFTARGQCIKFQLPDRDMTPYCATFVGRAILDKRAFVTLFTVDGHEAYGLYGLTKAMTKDANGALTMPISSMLLIKGDKAGTAPVVGSCQETNGADGHMAVDCKVTTVREGAVIEGSFETVEQWQKAERLKQD